MIVCTKCGFENEDSDAFCGSCAGFLEWSGQKVREEVEPEPEPEPEVEPEEAHQGFIGRVKDTLGIGEKDSDAASAPVEETVPASNGVEAPAAAAPEPGSSPQPAPPLTAAASTAPSGGAAPSGGGTPSASPVTAPAAAVTGAAPAAATTTSAPAAATTSGPASGSAAPAAATAAAGAAATSAAASPPPPVAKAAAATAPTAPAPPVARPQQPAAAQPTATATKTEAVQPAAVQPAAVQPQAVKPQALKARPTPKPKQPSTRTINPGDLVCGQCAEGNDPKRRFCRRCGASLQEAVVFTLPWYKKVWRALFSKKTRAAGERPKLRRRLIGGSGPGLIWGLIRILVPLAIVVILILAFVGPWKHSIRHTASRYYHDVVGVVHPTYTPVRPPRSGASANSQLQGFPPGATVDEASNSHWATSSSHSGVGATLVLRLASPSNIDKIGFLNGNQDGATPQAVQQIFLTDPVPEGIRVVFNQLLTEKTPQGTTVTKVVPYIRNYTLKDVTSFQTFNEKAKNVESVEITILSVYPPSNGSRMNASLAEVELFRKN